METSVVLCGLLFFNDLRNFSAFLLALFLSRDLAALKSAIAAAFLNEVCKGRQAAHILPLQQCRALF